MGDKKKYVLDRRSNRGIENECDRGKMKSSEETQLYDKFHLN
jgi:hypothetical protein